MAARDYTIKLPPAVGQRVARAAKQENRNPSDVATEAILWYFPRRKLPTEPATPAELHAIRRAAPVHRQASLEPPHPHTRADRNASIPAEVRAAGAVRRDGGVTGWLLPAPAPFFARM